MLPYDVLILIEMEIFCHNVSTKWSNLHLYYLSMFSYAVLIQIELEKSLHIEDKYGSTQFFSFQDFQAIQKIHQNWNFQASESLMGTGYIMLLCNP